MFSNAFRRVRRLVFLSLPRANKEPAEIGMGWRSVYVYYFAAGSYGRLNPLIHDYGNYSICIVSRKKSWKSGLSDGNTMTWYSPPRGRVASTFIFPPGVYNISSKEPDYAIYMLRFFHKERLEIRSHL